MLFHLHASLSQFHDKPTSEKKKKKLLHAINGWKREWKSLSKKEPSGGGKKVINCVKAPRSFESVEKFFPSFISAGISSPWRMFFCLHALTKRKKESKSIKINNDLIFRAFHHHFSSSGEQRMENCAFRHSQ